MKDSTRIGLIQMRCEKGDIAGNLAAIAGYLAEAARRRIDIVAFPEMCLTGYAVPTKMPDAMVDLDGPEVAQLLQVTRIFPGTVLAGFIEANPLGKPYITHVVARAGAMLGHYRKVTIEDEETEWFSPGDDVPLFHHDGLPFSLAICADISNRDVFARGSARGARLIFELAAPGLYGEQATRNWKSGYDWWEGECMTYLSQHARDFGVWVPVATQAGRTLDEDFPGGGYVFAPDGERAFATLNELPCAVFLEVDLRNGQVVELA